MDSSVTPRPRITQPKLFTRTLPLVALMQAWAGLGQGRQAMAFLAKHMFMPKRCRAVDRYGAHEGDVYVAVFPKSGTNWCLQICAQTASYGAAEFEHILEYLPWPEAPMPEIPRIDRPGRWRETPTGLRIIKTHLGLEVLPRDPRVRCLTMVRDPKEVFVSSYHFLTSVLDVQHRVSPDDWYELWLAPGLIGERWAEYSAAFWGARDQPNVLVCTYTEAKADLEGTVARIVEFLGVELTPEQLGQVVERASLPYMKAHEHQFAPPRMPLTRKGAVMVRRGQAGSSGELLTLERQARIDAHARETLRALGSDLPYDELFG